MAESVKAQPLRPAEVLAQLRRAGRDASCTCVLLTFASSARAEEPHFFELAIRDLVEAARSQSLDVEVFDALDAAFDAKALYASLTMESLFASSCVRVLRRAEALLKGEKGDDEESGKDADSKRSTRSREAAVHPLERATLAFLGRARPGERFVVAAARFRAPFLRAVREAGGQVFEFRPLYDKPFRGAGPIETTELGAFAAELARERGLRLGAGALRAILERTGNQLGAVDAALTKLATVAGERPIEAREIASHVPQTRPGNPWALAEAIAQGNPETALRELDRIVRWGAREADGKTISADGALTMALAALVRDARRHREAAERLHAGDSLEAVARAFAVPPFPAALDAFAAAVRARSPRGHGAFVKALLDAELSTRVHREPLPLMFARLAARARSMGTARA